MWYVLLVISNVAWILIAAVYRMWHLESKNSFRRLSERHDHINYLAETTKTSLLSIKSLCHNDYAVVLVDRTRKLVAAKSIQRFIFDAINEKLSSTTHEWQYLHTSAEFIEKEQKKIAEQEEQLAASKQKLISAISTLEVEDCLK